MVFWLPCIVPLMALFSFLKWIYEYLTGQKSAKVETTTCPAQTTCCPASEHKTNEEIVQTFEVNSKLKS